MKIMSLNFLFIFFLVSCGKLNQSTKLPHSNLKFSEVPYLVIPEKNKNLTLRSKILNQIYLLNTVQDLNTKLDIGFHEEFNNLAAENLEIHVPNEYNEYEINFVKIIVNYPDRDEVYFVLPGTKKNEILNIFGLKDTANYTFVWGDQYSNILQKNETYFIVATNLNELNFNQIHFQQKKRMFQVKDEVLVSINKYQKIKMNLISNIFQNELLDKAKVIKKSGCINRESPEDCFCHYVESEVSPNYIKTTQSGLAEELVQIFIGHRKMALNNSITEFIATDFFSEELSALRLSVLDIKNRYMSNPRNFEGSCSGIKIENKELTSQKHADVKLELEIFGTENILKGLKR